MIGAAAAAFTIASGTAFAGGHGAYPSKPIKIVVGFLLVVERIRPLVALHHFMHEAESMGGQPAYIVNISGASGQKGAKQVLSEKADGHTLYMINIGTFIVGELAKEKMLRTVCATTGKILDVCHNSLLHCRFISLTQLNLWLNLWLPQRQLAKNLHGEHLVPPQCTQALALPSSKHTAFLTKWFRLKVAHQLVQH